ncbi:hypothetical protein Tco_0808308 [Tanacetum coccineum]
MLVEVAPDLGKEMAAMGPTINKRLRIGGKEDTGASAPRKVLMRNHDTSRPTQSTLEGKSLAIIGLKTGSTFFASASQETPANVSDPDPLSFTKPQSHPEQDVSHHLRFPSDIWPPLRCKTYSLEKVRNQGNRPPSRLGMGHQGAVKVEVHGLRIRTKNLETLLEAEVDMKKATEAKNTELIKELESLRVQFSDLQVNNDQLSQQVTNLHAQVVGEEKMKAAFEAFKKYEDDRVEQRCVEIDARMDKLSVYFDEELYTHMLTAIAGRHWVIGHGLHLAVMKCAESSELRQSFANMVSAGLAKGMSEGLKYGIEHGKVGRELTIVEAYDPEADESDSGEDAPQWIRDLRPSSSQLKIPIYHEVRNPEDPWAIKEEMPLEDAIAANISHVEKKRKCRVVCRTHGVGSTHHDRSDGVPVSVPTIAPQGLSILLVDAATQTEDEVSPRLLRSKSLLPMCNLDWP